MYTLAYSAAMTYDYYTSALPNVMSPLINFIFNYDPQFRKSQLELLDLANTINNDKSATQQFISLLDTITAQVIEIKKQSMQTRDELARIRDDLILAIRNAETKIDELEREKTALQGQKEVLEKEIRSAREKIEIYETIAWFIPIVGPILNLLRVFDSQLDGTRAQLAHNRQEIDDLVYQKKTTQQLCDESKTSLTANQKLINSCDVIQNNINNIQSSLKRLEESRLLKGKLIALEKDWSVLMDIIKDFN